MEKETKTKTKKKTETETERTLLRNEKRTPSQKQK